MSSEINSSFDVEAQESLLENSAELSVETQTAARIIARKTFMRFLLLVRSTQLFKLAANYAAEITPSSSTSASYASITSSDEIPTQGSGIAAVDELSADSTHEDTLSVHRYERNIELQQVQRKTIAEIVKKKDLHDLHNFGGVRGAAEALNTNLEKGINISSPQQTCSQDCKCNPTQLPRFLSTILHSFRGACNSYTIFLLFCAAVLSLGFGIKEDGLHTGWFNGGILMATVVMLVIFTTAQKCWEEWSRNKLAAVKGGKLEVRVVRGGDVHFVSEIDLEAGDIADLKKGDQVPADGLFICSHDDRALELDDGSIKSTVVDENNPFLFYGYRVINGNARMLVTSTLTDTAWGEMMSQATDTSADKFESYLHKLNTCVQIAGLFLSILIIVALFLRYEAGNRLDDERRFRPDSKGEPTPVRTFVDAIKGIITRSKGTARVLTTLLSVSLLGVMEGIPFAISVAIIWSSRKLAHKASVRDYLASIKMARVTTIITDKFGGISMAEHEKEIDKFCVGGEFVSQSSVVASEVLEDLCDGIGTEFLIPTDDSESKSLPLISWAAQKLGMERESVIDQCKMIDHRGRDPLQEPCQVWMQKNGNGGYLHCKGPARDILSMCTHHYHINGRILKIDGGKKSKFEKATRDMLAEEAEVIAYACKRINDLDEESVKPNQLILLAMISMKKTKMEDTRKAVSTLMEGRIRTILASGDDLSVLEPIGRKYGLLSTDHGSDDLAVEAEVFRNWSNEERTKSVEKIRVMGNCLPSDKILLTKCLKQKGQVVALLAQKTADAPALKQADIGITYGTWSSQVARECCDISIWDGNCFGLMVTIITNSRCFQENIRKFIQLQLILAISSSLINFTAVVCWGDAPNTAVQLFWLNLVVGLVGGLALLTEPTPTALTTPLPVYKSSPKLITKGMWRNIAIQVSYQTSVLVTLQHSGQGILGTSQDSVKSVVYNAFFLCQFFNTFVAREPERKNFFGGLFHNNRQFWVASILFEICHVGFASAEKYLVSSPGLNVKLWSVCLLIGLVSWLLDLLGKFASDLVKLLYMWATEYR